jgi:hypothetical protein
MHAQLSGKIKIILDQPILDELLGLGTPIKCWLLLILPSLKLLPNHRRTQLTYHITGITIQELTGMSHSNDSSSDSLAVLDIVIGISE